MLIIVGRKAKEAKVWCVVSACIENRQMIKRVLWIVTDLIRDNP